MTKQLPDTPWHVGSPKMKESDHRRLNKWCIHYKSSFCTEPRSGCYMVRCGGSSHCKFYAEDVKTSHKIEIENRTQTEIDAENRRKYVETLKPKIQALIASFDGRRYEPVDFVRYCYVCGSKLLRLEKHRKQCPMCFVQYVDQASTLSGEKTIDGHYVYVMGQSKPKMENRSTVKEKEVCQFCNGVGRCEDKNSPLYQKRCNPRYCAKLKKQTVRMQQLIENEFVGVKNISMSRIITPNYGQPRPEKLDRTIKEILRNGTISKPIYVELKKDKYLIKDGYIRYLAAKQCGLTEIPATLERLSPK